MQCIEKVVELLSAFSEQLVLVQIQSRSKQMPSDILIYFLCGSETYVNLHKYLFCYISITHKTVLMFIIVLFQVSD